MRPAVLQGFHVPARSRPRVNKRKGAVREEARNLPVPAAVLAGLLAAGRGAQVDLHELEVRTHHFEEQRKLCDELDVVKVGALEGAMVRGYLKDRSRLIWDHHGTCHCGKRTYLFSQCKDCARCGSFGGGRRGDEGAFEGRRGERLGERCGRQLGGA